MNLTSIIITSIMSKKIIFLFLFLSILLVFPFKVNSQTQTSSSSLTEAQVLEIKSVGKVKNVKVKILSGDLKGNVFETTDNGSLLPYTLNYKTGDHVIVTMSKNQQGKPSVFISDYDRKPMLLLLFILFLLTVIAVARKQGIASLLGMLVSFYIILQVIIPNVIQGTNAFTITLIGSIIILPISYYLAHGFNKKTTIAIVGTFLTLLLVAGLSYLFTNLTKLTGYNTEEAVYLQNVYGTSLNVLNLLIVGIMIGALAVLNDITISQASIVASLKKSNKNLSKGELYKHTMEVGKDHVASLVNTLVLVYIGASFPLVLLFYNTKTPFDLILNQEIIATEIVRTIVTAIGVVAAVPITTYLACIFV